MRIEGLDELITVMGDPNLVGEPTRIAFTDSVLILEGAVKENMPVDTGRARQTVTHEVDTSQIPDFALVGSNVEYVKYLETGTKPHWPPLSALQPWARRHGFPPGRAGAFLVAKAIARSGTKARRMFETAFTEKKADIDRIMERIGVQIKSKIDVS